MEIANLKPRVWMLRSVITETEMNRLKELAGPKVGVVNMDAYCACYTYIQKGLLCLASVIYQPTKRSYNSLITGLFELFAKKVTRLVYSNKRIAHSNDVPNFFS